MPIFDHFSFLAPFYDRLIKAREPEPIVELLDLPISGMLLDAGGGTGRITKAFRGAAGALVIADLSHDMLIKANEKNEGYHTVCTISEKLPFPDNFFERVIMVDALHHVFDYVETVEELWRVLKPGGRLIIEEPDIRTFTIKLVAIAEKLALMRSRFVPPLKIQALFHYPDARTSIRRNGYNSWVIVDKI